MKADIVNIDDRELKKLFIDQMNKMNGTNLVIDPDSVHFAVSSANQVLLRDNTSPAGIVIKKVDIGTLFPTKLDISSFKAETVKQQVQANFSSDSLKRVINDFNNKMDKVTAQVEKDITEGFRGVPEDILNDFVLFCKVMGFFALKPKDISLSKVDNKLIIDIPQTHLLFSGKLEVTV